VPVRVPALVADRSIRRWSCRDPSSTRPCNDGPLVTYATRELEPGTWASFERLFRPGTGWAFCACMLYQRGCHLPARAYPTRDVARIENQRQKRELVEAGRAHGVLVFDGDEPIGWCQFGPVEELPLPGSTLLDRRIPPLEPDVDWRITCFVTAVRHRGRGVARAALEGVLAAIGRRGGGVVEAYPTTTPENANWAHAGSVRLFEGAGFAFHRRSSSPFVVMRRTIPPTIPR
jgi:GNAT superfamily N-acetyltransferase